MQRRNFSLLLREFGGVKIDYSAIGATPVELGAIALS